jgi:tetraacyldisaccharide 4'-kinase
VPPLLRVLLLPFAWLYALVMAVRNKFYDLNFKKTHRFPVPVLGVGNLAVGGTGKTPHVEYLVRLLGAHHRVATLSRGYGRQTKGFRLADDTATAATLGDEPYQLYRKFAPAVTVAVGERRAEAIPAILGAHPATDAIILDDAYQHRSVTPSLSILLTDYNRPFFRDHVLPAGRLREARTGASRAHAVIVTKCPNDLDAARRQTLTDAVQRYAQPEVPVFFTGIRYGAPVAFGNATAFHPDVVLVSGLANPAPLESYVRGQFRLRAHLAFRDHHHYDEADLRRMEGALAETSGQALLVTEKDYVKLVSPDFAGFTRRLPFFYLPMEVFFLENGRRFDELVRRAVFSKTSGA